MKKKLDPTEGEDAVKTRPRRMVERLALYIKILSPVSTRYAALPPTPPSFDASANIYRFLHEKYFHGNFSLSSTITTLQRESKLIESFASFETSKDQRTAECLESFKKSYFNFSSLIVITEYSRALNMRLTKLLFDTTM